MMARKLAAVQRRLWAAAALAWAAQSGAQAASGQATVRFEPPEVVASGLTAGGSAAWFGVAREPDEDGGITVVRRVAVTLDEDGDGEVRYALGGEPALKSLWSAVDLATGQVAVGTPEAFERRDIPAAEVELVAGSQAERLAVSRFYVEVLVARAGVGAWGLVAGDGGPSDRDAGVEGQIEVDLSSFTGVGEGAQVPPDAYQPGDVVVIVDPRAMEVYVGRVEAASSPGAPLVLVPLTGGAA